MGTMSNQCIRALYLGSISLRGPRPFSHKAPEAYMYFVCPLKMNAQIFLETLIFPR